MRRSGRLYQLICLLAAAGLLLGAVRPAHNALARARGKLIPPSEQAAGTTELDSFALGLMLGGFRGPLVMYLWVVAEDEKQRDQTEKFLTRSELIGDLQPYVAPIYVHQSWNLAYNVSVQYNSPAERYRWVRYGIGFAEKGNDRLPHNTDILSQLGHLYYHKLGTSYERKYYRARFRSESMTQLLDDQFRLKTRDPASGVNYAERWKYLDRLEAMVDYTRAALNSDGGRRQPFTPQLPPDPDGRRAKWPYGVSVFAIAYDYYKQAAEPNMPKHTTFGMQVISSRPAIACRDWADEEVLLAMEAEDRLWPRPDFPDMMPAPADNLLSAKSTAALFEQALYHYATSERLALLARGEYRSHLQRYPSGEETFNSHIRYMSMKESLGRAHRKRLEGIGDLLNSGGDDSRRRAALLKLESARIDLTGVIREVRDYIATQLRVDAWSIGDPHEVRRARMERLISQAQRALGQIEAIQNSRRALPDGQGRFSP